MAKHVVARVEEIPPGGRKIIRVEGREVGLFNLDGTFYALKNACPHQGVNGGEQHTDRAHGSTYCRSSGPIPPDRSASGNRAHTAVP